MTDNQQTALLRLTAAMAEALREVMDDYKDGVGQSPAQFREICELLAEYDAQVRAGGAQEQENWRIDEGNYEPIYKEEK